MVLAFAIFWVLAGLTVFLLAMRSGRSRGGHGGAGDGEAKAGQRLIVAAVLVATVFGLVVPAIVLAGSGGERASSAVGGLQLNAEQQHGRELFGESCALCHTLKASNAVGRIGPNLDVRLGSEIPTEAGRRALVLNAIAEGRARGLGQMPAQLYQGRDAEAVADYVAAVAGH
jgi:mono/diheme cytochrome c family protein